MAALRFPELAWVVSRARNAMRAERWAEAAGLYRRAIAIDATHAGRWIQYGHALKESGDVHGAEAAYRAAVRLAPHSADPHRQLGFLLKRNGEDNEARRCFIDGLAVDPGADDLARELEAAGLAGADLNAQLTVAALSIGSPSPAERRRQRGWFSPLRLPRAVRAADRASASRDWAGAAERYGAVLALDPYRADIAVQLGHVLKEQGDLGGAVAAYRRALASAPHDPDPHLHLGHAYKLLHDKDSAVAAYANAWRLCPGFGDVGRELRDFAGWSDDAIAAFGVSSWSLADAAPQDGRVARSVWRIPPGLSSREEQVWNDITFALEH